MELGTNSLKNDSIAHIADDGREHTLKEHLESTANLSSAFAAEFGCGEWGYLAGLLRGKEIDPKVVNYVS